MKSNDVNFEYIEEFVESVLDKVEADNDLFVTIIAKFDNVRDIFKEVMLYDNLNFDSLHIECPEMTGYNDEYVLSLWVNDGILEVGCEPLKVDGEYANPCGDITYLFDECSSKIIPLCDDSDLYFVNIEDDCECAEDCDCECSCDCHRENSCIEYSKTDDGELHGFTASKSDGNGYHSYSFYTSDTLSKDYIRDMLKEFGF